jgi:hypothetical protein
LKVLEHRMGFEPMNTGFADQRVSHFATGAHGVPVAHSFLEETRPARNYP